MRFLRWFSPSISISSALAASWETVLLSFAQVIGGVQRSRSMSVSMYYLFSHRRRRQKAGAFSCFFLFPSLFFFPLRCVSLAQQAVPPVVVVVRILFGGPSVGNFFRGIGYPYPALHGSWMVKAKRSCQRAKGFPVYLILHARPVVFIY
jgi:hypothetical protein